MPNKDDYKKVTVKLTRSPIGYNKSQRLIVQSLGLRKMNTVATHADSPTIRGMINKISHLLTVIDG